MTLFLILTGKWFDMIASGEKKEEYREITPYWEKRLFGKMYDDVLFQHGYSKNARRMRFKCEKIEKKNANPVWCNGFDVFCFSVSLGQRLN